MKVRKAVITAAGAAQHLLPLQTIVDRDGRQKSALTVIIEEAVSAGINEIGIVIYPGDESAYRASAASHAAKLYFIEQPAQKGYGYAVYCAHDFVGSEPFLHLVSDHLYISSHRSGTGARTCAQQLIDVAESQDCAVSAVQATHEHMLPYYGIVGGRLVSGVTGLYSIDNVIEKPTPTEAEQSLMVPGLRTGYYLSFFGMHVLTPAVFSILEADINNTRKGETIQLSPALARMAQAERYLAYEVHGKRYDIGVHYGMFMAQLALALSGNERNEVLTQLVEFLATKDL
ncbi:MAG TPA: sugar phosphate nucleotidyltransferase [Anaerolineae bacterium]